MRPPGIVTHARGVESVTPHAYRDVCALREDRVQVGAQCHGTFTAPSTPQPEHVPLAVDPHAVGSRLSEELGETGGAYLLHERRCWDLGELNQQVHAPRVEVLHPAQRVQQHLLSGQGLHLL